MAQGFLYLVAVLDWHARYVLNWELSNTLDVGLCLTALHAALARQPAPLSSIPTRVASPAILITKWNAETA